MTELTPEAPLTRPIRILAIAAHHDDLEFGPVGSICRWTDEGAEVTYCIVTDGSAGSNDPAVNIQELVALRKQEQLAAAAIAGVKEVRFLGYQDGTLQPTLELRRDLTRLIRELRPDRVVSNDPTTVLVENRYINHPDHRAVAEAALYAVFPSAESRPIFPELLDEGYEPHKVAELYLGFSMEPTVFVDTSSTLDRKIQALACHASQLGEEVLNMVRQWNTEGGEPFGVGAAESFRVMRFIEEKDEDDQAQEEAEEAVAESPA